MEPKKRKNAVILGGIIIIAGLAVLVLALSMQEMQTFTDTQFTTPGDTDRGKVLPPSAENTDQNGQNVNFGKDTTTGDVQVDSGGINQNISAASALEVSVNMISPTSASPFLERWINQYGNIHDKNVDINVNYLDSIDYFYSDSSSSEYNIYRLALSQSDLSLVGNIPEESQKNNPPISILNDLAFVPVAPRAVAVVYNIPSFPDVSSGLRLDSNLLYEIFVGNITYWDDDRIKEINQDFNLPHEKIVVVHEPRITSSAQTMLEYMATNKTLETGDINDFKWAENGVVQSGADAISATVRRTAYSIGYVDYSYAIQTKMTFASLRNTNGTDFVLPSESSITKAIENNTSLLINGSVISENITELFMKHENTSMNENNPSENLIIAAQGKNNSSTETNSSNSATVSNSSKQDPFSFLIKRYGVLSPLIDTSIPSKSNNAYPLTGFYYAVINNDHISTDLRAEDVNEDRQDTYSQMLHKAIIDLLEWITSDEGQNILSEVDYPELYKNHLPSFIKNSIVGN